TQDKAAEDKQLEALSSKSADVDKKAELLAAEEKKIQGTIDKSQGSVDTEGDEIHLRLVDKVLFAVGDDQLTDKGKTVLDKVAAALKTLPDKQVWVQGHTDDQPIYVAPKKVDPKAKPVKGAKPPGPAPVRFITNWELSAARALQVVHYLQDTAKIDPTRLAALAFGQYRPVSRSNRAANRRIEIVLYPKRAVLEKVPLAK
ncbi:MAG: OmpA family protein, partial [Kofleriaceae bacterium]